MTPEAARSLLAAVRAAEERLAARFEPPPAERRQEPPQPPAPISHLSYSEQLRIIERERATIRRRWDYWRKRAADTAQDAAGHPDDLRRALRASRAAQRAVIEEGRYQQSLLG